MSLRGFRKRGRVIALIAVGLAVGCSDSTGPDDELSDADREAVAQILTNSSVFATSPAAGFAVFFLDGLEGLGQMSATSAAQLQRQVADGVSFSLNNAAADEYDGFGFIVDFSISSQGVTQSGWMAGVVGMADLDLEAATAGELVSAFLMDLESTTAPSTGSGTIEEATAFATYWDGSSNYIGTSGMVDVTASSFGGDSNDCSGSAQGITVTCSYTAGTMTGSFAFEAQELLGEQTYTQAPISFVNLPAVRMSLTTTVN